jgi:hypothetical protein
MKDIERTFKHCNRCHHATEHQRNISKTGLLMFLIHVALVIVTAGFWLLVLIVYKILTAKIGGWVCSVCRH